MATVIQVQTKIDGLLKLLWLLIDLDASCDMGTPAGLKKTSSACYPPEMARCELAGTSSSLEELRAQLAAKEEELQQLEAVPRKLRNQVWAS